MKQCEEIAVFDYVMSLKTKQCKDNVLCYVDNASCWKLLRCSDIYLVRTALKTGNNSVDWPADFVFER